MTLPEMNEVIIRLYLAGKCEKYKTKVLDLVEKCNTWQEGVKNVTL